MENDEILISRNNLDRSSSPYLLQHSLNPVWWQEWSDELIKFAVRSDKPLLVSVGYSTCHWCHVMAAGAFSDFETAKYLNEHFICIKIDREQRPDIDQYMMDFITRQSGRGGWPLNVFLTPTLNPVFALTYAPVASNGSTFSFLKIAEHVYTYYKENNTSIPQFKSFENQPSVADKDSLIQTLEGYFDHGNGGFGSGQKFPSHSTLLYLLYHSGVDEDPSVKRIIMRTLDSMRLRGLHDHLQGGIFRYCVDNEWTIPHFEKMLYDQAMALWVYALAFKVTGSFHYKTMAEKILRCLDDSFLSNGLYISAHDADTVHEEGATYLWSFEELSVVLDTGEFARFREAYNISEAGNFEGLNHLIRRNDIPLQDIEEKLLSLRKLREQPAIDGKLLSGINALLAAAMIQAGRSLGRPDLEEKAETVVSNIISSFWDGKTLGHSSYNGHLQKQGFLFDAAALLLAITMLYENDSKWRGLMTSMVKYVKSFRTDGSWMESVSDDFPAVYASWFDHPIPSGISLAEMALTRAEILTGKDYTPKEYMEPYQSDFYNLSAMISNGLYHIFTSRRGIPWDLLSANSIQIRGEHEQDCYRGECKPLEIY